MELPYIRTSEGTFPGAVERHTRRTVELPEPDLNWIRVDHQFRIQAGDVEFVIESPFVLTSDGIDYRLDPCDRFSLGPALALYPNTIASASIDESGTLHLTFGDDSTITVPSDPVDEAWSIVGPGSGLIVCAAGTDGEISVWTNSGRNP